MPDPIARKLLKKKMLDRWENEGGRIANDTTIAHANRATSESKRHAKKRSSPCDKFTESMTAPPIKTSKPTRK